MIQGPKVAPAAAPAAGGGAVTTGKQSRLQSRNVSIVNNFHVHGHDSPHKVAQEVHRTFARSVEKHLSDGAYA